MRWLSEQDEASIVAGVVRALEQGGDFRPLSEDDGKDRRIETHRQSVFDQARQIVVLPQTPVAPNPHSAPRIPGLDYPDWDDVD